MSIIIVNSYLYYRYGNNVACIAFSKKYTVTNIEESNLIIHTTFLLRGKPLNSYANILKRCDAISII